MAAATLSQNSFSLGSVGPIIAQYAQITPADREYASKLGICLEVTEIERTTVINNTWVGIVQTREAEEFVDNLIANRVFIWVSTDSNFIRKSHFIFLEMAKSNFEKRFINDLAEAVQKKNISIEIHKGSSKKKRLKNYSTSFKGSCACILPGNKKLGTKKKYQVHLSLEDRLFSLLEDPKKGWHIGEMSHRRTLNHELIHIFQKITGVIGRVRHLPESELWTVPAERAAIQGDSSDGSIKEEYSENAFAVARGEWRRMTHAAMPNLERLPKSRQLLIAIALGADGTVLKILNSWHISQSSLEKINKDSNVISRIVIESSRQQGRSQNEKQSKEKLENNENVNILNLSELSSKEIVAAFKPGFSMAQGGTEDDLFSIAQLNRRNIAFTNLKMVLWCANQHTLQGEIVDLYEKCRAETTKSDGIKGKVLPIRKSLKEIRKKYLKNIT